MSGSEVGFLDDVSLIEEEDAFYTIKTRKSFRQEPKRYSTLEARRLVEDFLLKQQFHTLYEQLYDC